MRKFQARDWLDDLGEFSPIVVADACQSWRRSQSKRPTIADIRALCIEGRTLHDAKTNRQNRLPAPDRSQDEREDQEARQRKYEEAFVYREQWAQERGCDSYAHAIQIGINEVSRRPVRGAQ